MGREAKRGIRKAEREREEKERERWDYTKYKTKKFVLQMVPSRKWKDSSQNESKYMQITYLPRGLYPEHINILQVNNKKEKYTSNKMTKYLDIN